MKFIKVQPNNAISNGILECGATSKSLKWIEQPYTCDTFNDLSSASETFHFFINGISFHILLYSKQKKDFSMSFPPILYLDPPKIAIDSNRRLIENSNDTIVCHVIGSPNLRIYWKLDDVLFPSDKLDYNSIERMNKVVDDQLNVTCVAENQFGADFRTISIDLIGKMKKNDKLFYKLCNFEIVLYFH